MPSRKKSLSSLILASLGLAFCFFPACKSEKGGKAAKSTSVKPAKEQPILAPEDEVYAKYAGSASCKECHEAAYQSWEKSNHGLAEREYHTDMDEAGFKPKQNLTHGNQTSEAFLDADGLAKILTLGLGNKRRSYPVARVIGNDPLRQFLIPAPGGRMQVCDVSYDPAKNEWFDVYGDEERQPGDWGAWTGQGMNWNAMCAACHNTRLRKNYEPSTNSYHTTMAEMTVGCEACHGPMKDHVEWQKNPPPGYSKDSQSIEDPTARKFTRDQMLHTCAACHARRAEITGDLVPGESFYDHFSLTVTDESDTYHPDGQVRDEDYVFAAFSGSSMFHAGIRCGDCHEPHSNKRLIEGNLLCMRCHTGGTTPPAPIIDPTTHSHHVDGSTGNDCTNCHMPHTNYMQRHPRRDHGFTIPDPLLTKELGIPNACSRCHTDEDNEWALHAVNEWYGEKMERPTRTRARMVARARQGDPATRKELIVSLDNEKIAAWRATACHLLSRWVLDPDVTKALLARTSDPSPLVREAAVRTLTHQVRQNNPQVATALEPLLDDPIRSVRVAAAWALIAKLDLSTRAARDLTHMLDINSDQPTGRMQLSQFAFLRGDTPTAIRQIKKAIEWDPNSPPFHHDLAILLSTSGDTQGALKALQEAIRLDPQAPEFHYKIALAWNDAGNLTKSAAAFEKSLTLDPNNARAWYNLGLARNAMNQPRKAVEALLRGEIADPYDASIPYALATIFAQNGRRQEAIEAATRALQIRQDFPEAIQLIRSLSR